MRMGTAAVLLFVVQVTPTSAEEWSRFRGPGGSGVLESVNLPVDFGTDRNVRSGWPRRASSVSMLSRPNLIPNCSRLNR